MFTSERASSSKQQARTRQTSMEEARGYVQGTFKSYHFSEKNSSFAEISDFSTLQDFLLLYRSKWNPIRTMV